MGSKMRMIYPQPKGRRFQDENQVTFKTSKELKLKDVLRLEKSAKPVPCLNELGLLLTCLKENMFLEKECINETNDYYTCCRKPSQVVTEESDVKHQRLPNYYKTNVKVLNETFKKYRK